MGKTNMKDEKAAAEVATSPTTQQRPIVEISVLMNNTILCGAFFLHTVLPVNVLPPSVAVVFIATTVVFCACFRSVKPTGPTESISSKEAMQYPIFGSVVLFSLFIVLKFIPKYYINVVLNIYFCALGTFALAATVLPLLGVEKIQRAILPEKYRNKNIEFVIPKIKFVLPEETKVEFWTTE